MVGTLNKVRPAWEDAKLPKHSLLLLLYDGYSCIFIEAEKYHNYLKWFNGTCTSLQVLFQFVTRLVYSCVTKPTTMSTNQIKFKSNYLFQSRAHKGQTIKGGNPPYNDY